MEIAGFQRLEHLQRFDDIHGRARFWRLWNRLFGRPQTLLPFAPIHARLNQQTRYHRGLQEIPLRQIVGSLDKAYQFDRAFRPLSPKLRNRWAMIKDLHMTAGWEPIVVHQVGNLYFVEDGHHRVSVARDAGLEVIEAAVIEYPLACQLGLNDDLPTILRQLDQANGAASIRDLGYSDPLTLVPAE